MTVVIPGGSGRWEEFSSVRSPATATRSSS
jgi:hypothetical protein